MRHQWLRSSVTLPAAVADLNLEFYEHSDPVRGRTVVS